MDPDRWPILITATAAGIATILAAITVLGKMYRTTRKPQTPPTPRNATQTPERSQHGKTPKEGP